MVMSSESDLPVARAELDRAIELLNAKDARIASLERQLADLRPMAEIAGQLRKALVALLARDG